MTQVKYIIFIVSLLFINYSAFAAKTDRDYIREGNVQFRHKAYVQAEVNYRKALELNPNSKEALYNLGNTLSYQGKLKESIEQYISSSRGEKNKTKLAKIYHNAGVLFYSAKHYGEAVQAYRQSLRNNPNDDQTRYNLALAQAMLKKHPQQQNKDKKKDKQKDKNKEQDKKEQEKKNKPEDKSQNPKKNQMSKENAEQLLNAAIQDEKQLQDKVKKKLINQGNNLEKDW